MKDLKGIKGKFYIASLIEEGEHEHQDFKFAISDARKIARSLSAFANNDGGRLLIGVKDNGTVAGVRNEEDIYMVEQAAELYCRPAQHIEFTAFRVDAQAVVIRASIAKCDERPVQARDTDGTWSAYYRVADENIHAHPLMVAAWRRSNASAGGIVLRAGGLESRLLEHVASAGGAGVLPESVAPAMCISRASASGLITRLAAIGVLDFRYDGTAFRIVLPDAGDIQAGQ